MVFRFLSLALPLGLPDGIGLRGDRADFLGQGNVRVSLVQLVQIVLNVLLIIPSGWGILEIAVFQSILSQ